MDMDHPVLGGIAAAALGFDLIGRLDRVYLSHLLANHFLSVHARFSLCRASVYLIFMFAALANLLGKLCFST